jgi:hypothetical protein
MPTTAVRRLSGLAEPLLLAAAFAVAHTQAPLFYSNQNQYLLHGLANAGYGHLSHDWLATTRDPTPLFSAVVAGCYGVFGLPSLQVVYFALLMGYFLAARWLAGAVPWGPRTLPDRLAFAALFTTAHAAFLRVVSVRLTGTDYPWYLQAGLANQYVLGPGLQPSTFGVLLVAAVAAFARGRPVLAGLLTAGAGTLHATYLLPGALFTAGMISALLAERKWRAAVTTGAVTLLAVLPVTVFLAVRFAPLAAERYAEAQRVLATVRIPHHAVIARWFDGAAMLQLAWITLGLAAVRRTPLFWVLVVMTLGGAALTAVQAATGSHTLALMFPWRESAVLVPVSTALVAARMAGALPAGWWVGWLSAALLLALAGGGVSVMANRGGYFEAPNEGELFSWVRGYAGPDNVFLLPARFPKVGDVKPGPKVPSTSFTPPPRPDPNSNKIPVDLQRFRLATGAAIYIDFKSVPYAVDELNEWYRRVQQCEDWYANPDWDRPGLRDAICKEGVTHVVVPRNVPVRGTYLEPVYEDAAYTVYRVR